MSEKRYSFELRAEIRVEGAALDAPPMQAVALEEHGLPYEAMVEMQRICMTEPAVKLQGLGDEMVKQKKEKGHGKPDR